MRLLWRLYVTLFRHPAVGAVARAGGHRGVGAQRRRDRADAVGRGGGLRATLLLVAALGEGLVVDVQRDAPARDVDGDLVAGLDQGDEAARRRLGGDVADGEAARAAGEPAVGDQRAGFAQATALEE